MAKQRWVVGVLILIAICSGSGALYFARDQFSLSSEIHDLVAEAYNRQRPGGSRLSGTPYTPLGLPQPNGSEVGRAQVLLLAHPDAGNDRSLQGLVHLAAGEWKRFVDLVSHTSSLAEDAATLNNLGASYFALGAADSTFLLKAMDAFEEASRLDPKAPEPLFNLVLLYRQLRFSRLADEYFRKYSEVDPESPWLEELANPVSDEASIVDALEHAVESKDLVEAQRIFSANAELCRRLAMQYALDNEPESPEVLHFIAAEMRRTFGDRTIEAMLEPLFTKDRALTVALRKLVNEGSTLHQDGKYPESLEAFDEAARLARKTGVPFDRMWVDLNRLYTETRLGRFQSVAETLSRLVRESSQEQFLWLRARALLMYAATWRLTSTYDQMLNFLAEADREFIKLQAPYDRIRVLYYLSAYQYQAGDQEQALRLALECLRLLEKNDGFRTSVLDSLISIILYRSGMIDRSLMFATEAVEQSPRGEYANGLELQAPIMLAELYQAMSKHDLVEQYVKRAEEALEDAPRGDRARFEMMLGLLKAKTRIKHREYDAAEALLKRNVKLYSQQPFAAGTALLAPSLVQLAQLYADTGRTAQAARKFTEAINVVEEDDEYLTHEALRVKFDDERRNLYDSAIDFEINTGSIDAAYTDLQRYRAKLFLEFLAAFDPAIEKSRTRLDRAGIQKRIPADTQIIEYALVKDRLLIWVVTGELFTLRTVDVPRAEIESLIQTVLKKLRMEDDVDQLLTSLGRVLIEPVSDLLDPQRSLTIIPDRALHGLPFGAVKRGNGHYLIQDFPITVSPSLTHFLSGTAEQPARTSIVAFGSQNGGAAEMKELTALGDLYRKAATYRGNQVDKSTFLDALKTATVFHYAGHSATDATDPLRSSILLDGGRSGPNSVTAVDISHHRMAGNAVVILSSCDSSVGNSRDGVGVRGLTSAFLIAGAGSVVGSLWTVEASSTSELMIRFHQSFAKSGMPVARALREAQLSFLKEFPRRAHPYYWSGFVVTGNISAER